jgi:hypothetical protein
MRNFSTIPDLKGVCTKPFPRLPENNKPPYQKDTVKIVVSSVCGGIFAIIVGIFLFFSYRVYQRYKTSKLE